MRLVLLRCIMCGHQLVGPSKKLNAEIVYSFS
jgi:hypothetical protein